jgi:hypothetical protein
VSTTKSIVLPRRTDRLDLHDRSAPDPAVTEEDSCRARVGIVPRVGRDHLSTETPVYRDPSAIYANACTGVARVMSGSC